jgi:hypothetical protein
LKRAAIGRGGSCPQRGGVLDDVSCEGKNSLDVDLFKLRFVPFEFRERQVIAETIAEIDVAAAIDVVG